MCECSYGVYLTCEGCGKKKKPVIGEMEGWSWNRDEDLCPECAIYIKGQMNLARARAINDLKVHNKVDMF